VIHIRPVAGKLNTRECADLPPLQAAESVKKNHLPG
jgi:hypothetical protein